MRENIYQVTGTAIPINNTSRHITGSVSSNNIRKLSIIIPCYNEAATISIVLNRIADVTLNNGIEKEIIIINDCSTDNTDQIIKNYITDEPKVRIHYIQHALNQGKGAAIQTGIARATGDLLIIQDADLEYDPTDYNLLLSPILKGYADVVYGSRFIGGNPHRILFFWHTIGNRILTLFSNMLSNLNLTDMETGYKLFKTSLIQQIPLREKRFGFEPEITVKLSHVPNIRLYEVGISYFGRTYQEGKKIGLKDAFRCVYCLIKYHFSPGNAKNIILQQENTARMAKIA